MKISFIILLLFVTCTVSPRYNATGNNNISSSNDKKNKKITSK